MNPGNVEATWSTMSMLSCTTSSWLDGSHRKVLMKVTYAAPLTISGIGSVAVAGPRPAGHLAQRVQLVVSVGVRVLHRHLGAELDVLANRLAKLRVGRHPSRVERPHIEPDEPLALLLCDPQPAMHGNEVGETELA